MNTNLTTVPEQYQNEQIDAVFFFALDIESAPFEELLKKKHAEDWSCCKLTFGKLYDFQIAVVRTGAGRKKATKSAARVLSRLRPQVAYSAGFAGALNPKLEQFEILDPIYPMNYPPVNIIDVVNGPENKKQWGLYTADRVVVKLSEKSELFERYGMDAVDMETDAVAEVCQYYSTPLRCVRIISDDAKEELPKDIENILNQNSDIGQWGAALGAVFRKPARALDLIKLKNTSVQAAQLLAQYLDKTISNGI